MCFIDTSDIEFGFYEQLTTAHGTLAKEHNQLKSAVAMLAGAITYEDIGKKLGEGLKKHLVIRAIGLLVMLTKVPVIKGTYRGFTKC